MFTLYYNVQMISEVLTGIRKGILSTGSEFERLSITLLALTKNQAIAHRQLEYLYEYASKTPFTIKQVITAWKILSAYGVANQRTLQATLNLTLAFNKNIEDTANAIGRALKGSTEGFEVLRRSLGANTEVLKKFDSSTTITPHFRCVPVVLAADSIQEMSGSFDFVTGARDCDYDEVDGGYVVRIICECDVWVVICSCEFPDLASIYVEADRLQVSWRHASASGSPT